MQQAARTSSRLCRYQQQQAYLIVRLDTTGVAFLVIASQLATMSKMSRAQRRERTHGCRMNDGVADTPQQREGMNSLYRVSPSCCRRARRWCWLHPAPVPCRRAPVHLKLQVLSQLKINIWQLLLTFLPPSRAPLVLGASDSGKV